MRKQPNSTFKLWMTALLPGGFILPFMMVWGLLIAQIYCDRDDNYEVSHALVSALLAGIANVGLYASGCAFVYLIYITPNIL